MKVLLIGPFPPPHGGISVHVAGIHRQLNACGIKSQVLDTGKGKLGLGFAFSVLRYAIAGWTLHLHTNGHNQKSWLLACFCGLAGRIRGGSILTLHSGMVPVYLESASRLRKVLARRTCELYTRVICVSPEIRSALRTITPKAQAMEVLPAFLGTELAEALEEPGLCKWLDRHRPVFSTVLFFRPEYDSICWWMAWPG